MQLRWIALIYLEASLCTYGNAALILVEAKEYDLIIAIRPRLLRTLCILSALSHVIADTVRRNAHISLSSIIGNTSNRLRMLVRPELGLVCESSHIACPLYHVMQ